MKKMYIVCESTSADEIIAIAKRYLIADDFEVQEALDDAGNLCLQGRKTSLLRNVSGTSYAIQLQVHQRNDGSYVLSAGWGKWMDKVLVGGIATFVAFGFMLIPVIIGGVIQKKLPQKLLSEIYDKIQLKYPDSRVFMEAKS